MDPRYPTGRFLRLPAAVPLPVYSLHGTGAACPHHLSLGDPGGGAVPRLGRPGTGLPYRQDPANHSCGQCYGWLPGCLPQPAVLHCLRLRLSDDVQQDLGEELPRAEQFMAAALCSGAGWVPVHCSLGRSRSSELAIAFLMEYHQWPLRHAFQWLEERRACAVSHAEQPFAHSCLR
uniref:Tyrosine specific protein phosphatases domain-containing protein n=1 Tax=Paramormyrops kingsleyae TaxID=1676925 RepID=A0A3B3R315_9TELE